MPQLHSRLYLTSGLVKRVGSEKRLAPLKLTSWLNENGLPVYSADGTSHSVYDQMSDLLREVNDAQFGIVSKLEGGQWVRDATSSIPLEERTVSHDAPVIEGNNMLLRCLSRLRAIDYAIAKKYPDVASEDLRVALKQTLSALTMDVLSVVQSQISDANKLKAIEEHEKQFDTYLVTQLHEANLTKGCQTIKDAEALLTYYRNLSSLLVPTRSVVTLTYDRQERVLERETQYPVTTKTELQRKAIQALRDISPYPHKEEKNAHTIQIQAIQEADSLFVDLMECNDRVLPAQTRKTHLVGAKNAFIVKNELIFLHEHESLEQAHVRGSDDGDTLWLARSGVPVYVGKGETDEQIQIHTQENLEQIRIAAKKHMGFADETPLLLHVTTLNTVSPLENQATMVKHLYKATRERGRGDDISYAPINVDGTFRLLDIAPSLTSQVGVLIPRAPVPLQKASRLDSVVSVMLNASQEKHKLSVVQCASGQDRTGTAVEKTVQRWMGDRYSAHNKWVNHIQIMRAEGGNAAEIATHLVHGSPGMKKYSAAKNRFGTYSAFGTLATQEFYRTSADSNKSSPLKKVDFLMNPSSRGIQEYNDSLEQFVVALNKLQACSNKKMKEVYERGQGLLAYIQNLVGSHLKSLDAKTLADCSSVLFYCTQTVNDPNDINSIKKLTCLAKAVSGHESPKWRMLGTCLLWLAVAACVAVGLLFAMPTSGLSLAVAIEGAVAIAGVGAAGGYFKRRGKEKGLAKELNYFRSGLPQKQDDVKQALDDNQADNLETNGLLSK